MARYVQQYSPNLITTLLVAVAGVILMLKAGGSPYWLIPAMTASLLGGVASGWLFLVKLTGWRRPAPQPRRRAVVSGVTPEWLIA